MGPKRGRAASPPSLKALAIGYLSRREYSRVELRGRLLSAAAVRAKQLVDAEAATATAPAPAPAVEPTAEVDALLDWLVAQGYLSDARFVESRLHARAARHGSLRIRQELGRHGVELDAQQAAALRATEFDRAKAVWERKFGAVAADARGRAAQARFLAGRGFGAEVVRRIVGGEHDE
jgi:regulatory protein